jgi:mRNA interferase MazF
MDIINNLKDTFAKNFVDWFNLKPKLDISNNQPPLVDEGQIWWCHLGENIGTEISGKGQKYTRPVVIYKKLSRYTFLVIPCSTKLKEGSWFVKFVHKNIEQIAVLNQIRIIDYRRLDDKIGILSVDDFDAIKTGFKKLYSI